ncbi:MAG: hypothetical protein ACT4QB_02260 [Gammaproteobacteria bacterium]
MAQALELEPFAAPYSYTVRTRPVTPGEVIAEALLNRPLPQNQSTQNEAAVTTLNSFYQAAMSKTLGSFRSTGTQRAKGGDRKTQKTEEVLGFVETASGCGTGKRVRIRALL